jgi:hypothetical protein
MVEDFGSVDTNGKCKDDNIIQNLKSSKQIRQSANAITPE